MSFAARPDSILSRRELAGEEARWYEGPLSALIVHLLVPTDGRTRSSAISSVWSSPVYNGSFFHSYPFAKSLSSTVPDPFSDRKATEGPQHECGEASYRHGALAATRCSYQVSPNDVHDVTTRSPTDTTGNIEIRPDGGSTSTTETTVASGATSASAITAS